MTKEEAFKILVKVDDGGKENPETLSTALETFYDADRASDRSLLAGYRKQGKSDEWITKACMEW